MGFLALFSSLSLATFAIAQSQTYPAVPLATNQPSRMTYQAILQDGKPIAGSITGVAAENGTGVTFNIDFHGFPDPNTVGPFTYHIHVNPVIDGNCTTASTHLAPYNGPNDTVVCNAAESQFCQVGDLSGKHGKITPESLINGGKYINMYTDVYVSALDSSPAFFGNRSIVVHAQNGTRLNCANFVLVGGAYNGTSSTSGQPTGTGTATASQTGVVTATGTGAGQSGTGVTSSSTGSAQPSVSSVSSARDAGGLVIRDVSSVGLALLLVSVMMLGA